MNRRDVIKWLGAAPLAVIALPDIEMVEVKRRTKRCNCSIIRSNFGRWPLSAAIIDELAELDRNYPDWKQYELSMHDIMCQSRALDAQPYEDIYHLVRLKSNNDKASYVVEKWMNRGICYNCAYQIWISKKRNKIWNRKAVGHVSISERKNTVGVIHREWPVM